jgi:hypothetical protein
VIAREGNPPEADHELASLTTKSRSGFEPVLPREEGGDGSGALPKTAST